MNAKQQAAEAALQFVRDGMVIGLGTGTTATFFLHALADALLAGRLRDIRGVPTSRESEHLGEQLGIPLATLVQCPHPDLTVDGADEIDPNLDLIKGLGGALLREKIVAQASRQLIIIADSSKTVPLLGTRAPLPVEVVPFAHEIHEAFFRDLGATPELRRNADGSPFITDNGNLIYHCRFPSIPRPVELETTLHRRAGIVETGMFLNLAQTALIADGHRVEERTRATRTP